MQPLPGRLFVCALAMSASLTITNAVQSQTTYYVNGSCGDDSWTGLSPVCEAPDGPKATVQAGIDAAGHFDTIVVADGVYTGKGNRGIQFFEKELYLHSAGGPQRCIIDCEQTDVAFDFCHSPNDRPVTIEGFTIRRGVGLWTGGICIANADVQIRHCVIEECRPNQRFYPSAGGVAIFGESVTVIENTTIRGNTNTSLGGGVGIYDGAIASIDSSLIEGNEAANAGAGIHVDRYSGVHITRSVVSRNITHSSFSAQGGGITKMSSGDPSEPLSTIQSTLFLGNEVVLDEGARFAMGGGAYLMGRFIVLDCEFVDNYAVSGGALAVTGDSFQVVDAFIHDNEAAENGGGILVGGGSGGLFERVRLVANAAGLDGGGAYGSSGAGEWSACEFIGNVSARNGGGLHGGSLTGNWLAFSGNHAGERGGAAHLLHDSILSNSLLSRNEAQGEGGAVYVESSSVKLTGATVAFNSAPSGGGLFIGAEGGGAPSLVVNSILHANEPDAIIDSSGRLVVQRSVVSGGWRGVGNLDADPMFVDAGADNFALLPASPCIDAGDNRQVVSNYDLAGDPRRVDDRGMPDSGYGVEKMVDIGCYEFQDATEAFVTVHPQPGVAGEDNRFQVAGAVAESRVFFVYGFSSGMTPVPGCPELHVDTAQPRLVGQTLADRHGDAELTVLVPAEASRRTILIQAVDRQACAVTNAVRYRFP